MIKIIVYFWKIKVFQDVIPNQLSNIDQSTLCSVLEGLSIQQHCCKNLSLTCFFLQDLHLFLQNTSTPFPVCFWFLMPSFYSYRNAIPFTPTQVEAIRAGMQPGLTLVVGPPGTGKTDVAVQIISNLYHNFPAQRTLIVTHSNQALNQLFEKIMQLDIDERHLLRLGHGEEALETEKDFSRSVEFLFLLFDL